MVYINASSTNGSAFMVKVNGSAFTTRWNTEESVRSSIWRELRAVEVALDAYVHILYENNVKWYTDSTNVVNILRKGRMKMDLNMLALSIYKTCLKFNIHLDIEWVPRDTENLKIVDYLSKHVSDPDNSSVANSIFSFEKMGPRNYRCICKSHKQKSG